MNLEALEERRVRAGLYVIEGWTVERSTVALDRSRVRWYALDSDGNVLAGPTLRRIREQIADDIEQRREDRTR